MNVMFQGGLVYIILIAAILVIVYNAVSWLPRAERIGCILVMAVGALLFWILLVIGFVVAK